MKRATVALLLALLSACDNGPAGPEPISDIDILLNSMPLEEETMQVGETVQLTATLKNADGRPVTDRRAAWRSTAPTVATVDSTGLVSAVSVGSARIIASAAPVADTVQITVIAPTTLPSEITCPAGSSGIAMQPGQVLSLSAQQQPIVCLSGGAGSEYTLIPFHAAASTARLAVEVAASGVVPAVGPPNPSLLPSSSAELLGRLATEQLPLDRSLDRRMREWERRNFAALRSSIARAESTPDLNRTRIAAPVPGVGDTLHLNVNSSEACTNPRFRVGRVEAVTQHAIVVADTSNPAGGFTRDEYRAFGVTFDTLVWKVDVANFGEPKDLDKNGKILIFFTRAVNELTEEGSNAVVGGFFFGRDLFQRTGTGSTCAGSNQAELFYMLVPDPTGVVNKNVRTKQYVTGTTVSVIAHEFQHLINFSRRLFVNNATVDEQTWLNEGLSHIAEELVFYEAANLQPEMNLTRERALTEPIRARFIEYQISNFGRYRAYLEDPANASPLADDDDLSTRGATWAFLRYAADRKSGPGGERQIWFDLVNSRTRGVENLANVLGVNPLSWLEDWTVSVYTDDAGLPVEPRYTQPSWNFRSIFPAFRSTNERFPLRTVSLGSGGTTNQQTFNLQGGGAAFVRFGIASGAQAAVRISSGGRVAPARLQVMIVRTK